MWDNGRVEEPALSEAEGAPTPPIPSVCSRESSLHFPATFVSFVFRFLHFHFAFFTSRNVSCIPGNSGLGFCSTVNARSTASPA